MIAKDISGLGDYLYRCPNCGSDHTHQKECQTFWRYEERGKADHVTTAKKAIMHIRDVSNAPWDRSSILVIFTCEGCEAVSQISIRNHKGQTVLCCDVVSGGDKGSAI